VHVLQPGLALALLDPPVAFRQMGSDDEFVDCRLAVMLLVTDSSEQVTVLNRLVTVLQDPTLESRLSTVSTPQELAATFSELIG
jgi:PTS system galactitol-specific IIA component